MEKKSKKQLVLFSIGILLILALIVKYGIDAITGFGNVTNKLNKNNSSDNSSSISLDRIDPPLITQLPNAVQQNKITVTGTTTQTGGSVELFVNNKSFGKADVDGQEFTFQNVQLTAGDNILKVRQTVNNKSSDFSRDFHITYAKEPPKLDISFPTDGEKFGHGDQEIDVTGKTGPQNKVTVNTFWAIVDDQGNFTYHLTLNQGDNAINVEATNPAGVKTDKTLHVTFNP